MSLITTDYGKDVLIGKVVSPISGSKNLINALVRRLSTMQGSLFYDPQYGYDVRQFINAEVDDQDIQQIETNVENQIEQDERVSSCRCTAQFDYQTQKMRLEVQVTPFVDRTFTLILSVDNLTVKLLTDSINQG